MNNPERYCDIARTCISAMIRQLTTSMQRYNTSASLDNRSAGLYRNDVYQLTRLLTECGFKPNIKETEVVRDGNHYMVYQSVDFNAYAQEMSDMGIIIGVAGSGVHEFSY